MTSSARLTKDKKRHDPAALREFGAGPIEIETLGGVRIRQGSADITTRVGKRHLAVLIYVLHERRPITRRDLLSLLGKGGADDVEDEAVSRTVAWLNHNLRGIDVDLTPEAVSLAGDISLDSVELLEAFELGDAEKARQLYRGRFLEGFSGPGQRFDDWAEGERLRLHEAWSQTMRSAAAAAETAGIWSIAADWWKAIVERDPLKHDAVARLLLTLGLAKDRKGAALAYAGYRARLREHGVAEPPDVVKRVASKLELPEPVVGAGAGRGATSPGLSGAGAYVDPATAYVEPDEEAEATDRVEVLRPDSIALGEHVAEDEGKEGLFTDSFIVYAVKTGWARVTSPAELARARNQLKSYGPLLSELFEAIRLILATVTRPIWKGIRSVSSAVMGFFRERRTERTRSTPSASTRTKRPATPSRDQRAGHEPSSRRVGVAVEAEAEPARPAAGPDREVSTATPRAEPTSLPTPPPVSPLRRPPAPEREDTSGRPKVARSRRRRRRTPLFARISRNIAWKASLRSAWRGLVALPGKALRYPVATLTLVVAIALLLAPSNIWDWTARRYVQAENQVRNFSLPSVPKIRVSLPDISLPDVSLPGFSGGLPGFVQRPVWSVSDFFTGALVESGDRVMVADIESQSENSRPSGHLLGLALEAQLAQSRFFATVPRERVLVADGSLPDGFSLPSQRALELAPIAAARVIVGGTVTREEEAYNVRLVVLDPAGVELTGVDADDANLLRALDAAARTLRHKLGEPAAEIAEGHATARILTNSFEALNHYARARALLEAGDYRQASRAAASALDVDPAFAAAHRLQGNAFALSGDHRGARVALETAWKFRVRLSERERLRLEADRLALRGDHPEAILAYDELFTRYRHDVTALKSQALLQESIGVRGGGSGNLRVAYSLDSQDWPPLSRIARFLDYRGPLPEISPYIDLASQPGDSVR